MFSSKLPAALVVGAAMLAGTALTGCGDDNDGVGTEGGGTAGASAADAKTIALLLANTDARPVNPRVRPAFAAELARLCADCELLYAEAGSAGKQRSQAEAVIVQDADVLVMDPVDPASAATIVSTAADSEIPVVSYDQLITDANLAGYVSYDGEAVGQLQGRSLVNALDPADGKSVVALTGPATDDDADEPRDDAQDEALELLEQANVRVAERQSVADGTASEARKQMKRAIDAVGAERIDGVYAADDQIASGAIAAMESADIDPSKVPTTGQGGDLAAIQRIVAGDQYMTVFRAPAPEAQAAAQLAFSLSQGTPPPSGLITDETDNAATDVPSALLDPVAVTRDTVKSTVVGKGAYTVAQICTAQYAAACRSAGLSGN